MRVEYRRIVLTELECSWVISMAIVRQENPFGPPLDRSVMQVNFEGNTYQAMLSDEHTFMSMETAEFVTIIHSEGD